MFAADFDYHRAMSVAEAGQLLKQYPGAKLLAGGHSLIPLLKLRLATPATVIDIGRIAELRGVTLEGDRLRVGALTTHAAIAASDDVRRHAQALAEAAAQIGDPAVRNRGTVGGNIAHADPASDLPTVLCALGGQCHIVGPDGERTVEAGDFFQGLMTTALEEQDVLTAVSVQRAQPGQGSAYVKFAHPASRYAVVGVAASLTADGGRCTAAAVAIGSLVPAPIRAVSVEGALTGQTLGPDTVASAARATDADLGDDILGDVFASSDYRRAIAPVYIERAVAAAAERVG